MSQKAITLQTMRAGSLLTIHLLYVIHLPCCRVTVPAVLSVGEDMKHKTAPAPHSAPLCSSPVPGVRTQSLLTSGVSCEGQDNPGMACNGLVSPHTSHRSQLNIRHRSDHISIFRAIIQHFHFCGCVEIENLVLAQKYFVSIRNIQVR